MGEVGDGFSLRVALEEMQPDCLLADDYARYRCQLRRTVGRGLPEEFDLSTLHGKGHFGLLGISERVALLGGRSRVQNQPGGGLLVEAENPHPRMEQPDEDW